MKRLLILFLFLFFINCAEKVIDDPWRSGIAVQTINALEDQEITFELIPLGTVFCRNADCEYETERTGRQTVKIVGSKLCVDNGFKYLACDAEKVPLVTGCATEDGGLRPFGNGFYNLHIKVGPRHQLKTFVYIDNRHCGFPYDPNCKDKNCAHENFTLRFDVETSKLYYKAGITDDASMDGFKTALKGEALNWWEVSECSDICFDGFTNLPFPVLDTPTVSAKDAPEFSWTNSDEWKTRLDVFELQRSVNGNSFYTIHTPSPEDVLAFTDESVLYDRSKPGQDLVQYRLKVKFLDQLVAEFSNVQKIYARSLGTNRAAASGARLDLALQQNRPNPVAGKTSITYTLPRHDLTSLKVYDSAGREVATLVNEKQGPGERTVEFDASNLQPGKYIYRIRIGRTTAMKEMTIQ